jgi:putative membrane protein insertion efficiency factor
VVFDGPWRRRRREQEPYDPNNPGYGPYDPPGYPPQYGPRYRRGLRGYRSNYGYGGNSSCLRDLLLLDVGCCLAEGIGCGGNLLLVAPSAARRLPAVARMVPALAAAPTAGGPPVAGWLRRWSLALIALYQQEVSARRPPCCRFSPTCSHYAAQALQTHGVGRAAWLILRRLLRCRPGAAGGYDPVPS